MDKIVAVKGSFPVHKYKIETTNVSKVYYMDEKEVITKVETNNKYRCEFCYIYEDAFMPMRRIGNAGIVVLSFIMENMKFNNNLITLNAHTIAKSTHLSNVSVSRGIASLVENRFIEKGKKPFEYIINYNYIFKGNIVEFLKVLINENNV